MRRYVELLQEIPFFFGKRFLAHTDIYLNDAHPVCLLVDCEGALYKVRFPSVLNTNAVQSEKETLMLLHKKGVPSIPHIITDGVVKKTPYIIENYVCGSSLDKIYHALTHEDWKCISNRITSFLLILSTIRAENFFTFKESGKKYSNYGAMLRRSIVRHLSSHVSAGTVPQSLATDILETIKDIESAFEGKATFLHFDLKPQNIIFDPMSGNVFFIDFEHSRFGDFTHELFRGDMAAVRNPYFRACWETAKQNFISERLDCDNNLYDSGKTLYFDLLYSISEMSHSVYVNDSQQTAIYLRRIEEKIRQAH